MYKIISDYNYVSVEAEMNKLKLEGYKPHDRFIVTALDKDYFRYTQIMVKDSKPSEKEVFVNLFKQYMQVIMPKSYTGTAEITEAMSKHGLPKDLPEDIK